MIQCVVERSSETWDRERVFGPEGETEKAITCLKIDGEVRRRETRCHDSGVCGPDSLCWIETVAVEDVKGSLPEKLFATDRYPCERINMYSAIDNLRALETH
ncbi:hypothetical protein YC2023_121732 [Brassica napus]